MAKFQEKSRRSVRDIIKSGSFIDIFRNPKNNNLVASMNGGYLGIDHRVKEMVEEVADADQTTKVAAFKKLANQCSVAELRQVDDQGNPMVTGVDPQTGKAVYAEFVPCLVLDTVSQNTVCRLDASMLD